MTGGGLDARRWQRLTEWFDRALDLDVDARRKLIEQVFLDDRELGEELQSLLAADAGASPLDEAGGAQVHAQLQRALHDRDHDVDLIGCRIGVWRIERLLGRGGMGQVFLAERDDGEFEQRVALKLLRSGLIDELTRRQFLEERRVLARLSHPHIARLYDGGLGPDGVPWYAMEYVDGESLIAWCDARRLGIAARIDLFNKVCEAADFAHRQLVVHRDIKPGNILVGTDGEPKLLDFGIAKLLSRRDAQTRSGTPLMTLEYAAPEQLRGEPVGTAADVYSLGAVLFELLTGQRPFSNLLGSREPPSAIRACTGGNDDLKARAAARAFDPKHLRTALRGDLERILRAALDPAPARRYRSAAELSADLREHLRGQPISLRHDRGYRFAKFVGRHRAGVAAGTLAVLALVAALGFSLFEMQRARTQARTAEAVRDFMVNVFASADPSEHPGAPPNARTLLDAGARRMTQRFSGDPKIEAALSQALADSYAGLGEHGKARQFAQTALQLAAKAYGPDSAQALAARIDYAEKLHAAAKEDEAIQQARQVLAMTGDAASRVSVRAHLVIAGASRMLDDNTREQAEARRALALSAKLPGDSALLQGEAWRALAGAELAAGQGESASQALRKAVVFYTRSSGANAVETMAVRRTLIFALMHSGRADEAAAMYKELITQESKVLGSGHPSVITDQCAYAYVLWHVGDYRHARQVTTEVLAVFDRNRGTPQARWYDGSYLLAEVEVATGNLSRAQHIIGLVRPLIARMGADAGREGFDLDWLQALADAESGKPGGPERLTQLFRHAPAGGKMMAWTSRLAPARAMQAQGQFAQALRAYRDLEAGLSSGSRTASHLASLQLGEGVALTELGRYAEARPKLDAALVAFRKPEQVLQAETARLWRGWLTIRSGHAADGLPDIETALAWRRQQLGEDSWLTAEALLAHAEALSRLGHHKQARAEQAAAQRVLAAQLLPTNALLQRAQKPLPH